MGLDLNSFDSISVLYFGISNMAFLSVAAAWVLWDSGRMWKGLFIPSG